MIYEYFSFLIGILKTIVFKILYFNRVSFTGIPKMNHNFKIAIKKNSKLHIGKKFRTRNNVSFRIYKGIVEIGDNCFFNDNCSINCLKNIKIGNNCIFGPDVKIYDHDHDYKKDMNSFVKQSIEIGNNVWIGANVVILKGVKIGDNSVIAAGTIVKHDVSSNTLVYNKNELVEKVILYEKN